MVPITGASCTITAPNISINIGNIHNTYDRSFLFTFNCTNLGKIKDGYVHAYCWHIHGGLKSSVGDDATRVAEQDGGRDEIYFSLNTNTYK